MPKLGVSFDLESHSLPAQFCNTWHDVNKLIKINKLHRCTKLTDGMIRQWESFGEDQNHDLCHDLFPLNDYI